MVRKSFSIVILVALAITLAGRPAPAAYNALQNGSFETATVDPGAGIVAVSGTTITGWWNSGMNYVGTYWQASQGGRSVEFNNTIMQQNLLLTPGNLYQVTFDLAGNPDVGLPVKSLQLYLEYQFNIFYRKIFQFDTTGKTRANMGWASQEYFFWAPFATPVLNFFGGTVTDGPALDNVVIRPVTTLTQNGGFEYWQAPPLVGFNPIPPGSTILPGWSVLAAVTAANSVWTNSEGSVSLDLNSGGAPGALRQSIATVPGERYQVSFDLAGLYTGPPAVKTLRVSDGTTLQYYYFDTTNSSGTNMGWTRQNFTFTATATLTNVTFTSLTSSSSGPALDNVWVQPLGQVNLIQNGSFEIGPAIPPAGYVQLNYGDSSIQGWTVGGNSIDLESSLGWQPTDGNNSVDLSGVGAGSLEQSFLTIPGTKYLLRFDLAGNAGAPPAVKDLRVTVAGVSQDFSFDTTGKSYASMGWITKTLSFIATSPVTTLVFESLTNTNAGPVIDNVRVTKASATMPYLLLLLE